MIFFITFVWGKKTYQQIILFSLRQKSAITMNRGVKWSQNPPNFNEYGPECVQGAVFAPFQQSARPLEDAPAKTETKSPPSKASRPSKAAVAGVADTKMDCFNHVTFLFVSVFDLKTSHAVWFLKL